MPTTAPMQSKVRLPFLLAGAGALALAAWKFSDLKAGVSTAASAAVSAAFDTVIPSEARAYASIIKEESARRNISPFVTVALGIRESRWGYSLRPMGPGGTGDFVARQGRYLRAPGVQIVNVLPPGWAAPRGTSAPWAIPADGQGWGRGLMQIDYGAFYAWIQANNWADPRTNIRKGLEILAGNLEYFSRASTDPSDPRPLSGNDLLHAGLAAYNAGAKNVIDALKRGDTPDSVTTGADYGGAVLNAALALQAMLG